MCVCACMYACMCVRTHARERTYLAFWWDGGVPCCRVCVIVSWQVITGTFVIQNTQITSLEGLSGLTTLGTLTLDSNLQLTSISGLFASVEVQCSLEAEAINIFNSPELVSLAGLENVGLIQGKAFFLTCRFVKAPSEPSSLLFCHVSSVVAKQW